jgi:hypothetical protein
LTIGAEWALHTLLGDHLSQIMAAKPWQSIRNPSPDNRPDPAALVEGQIALNTAGASPAIYFKDAAGNLAKAGAAQVGTTAPNATPGGFAGNSKGEQWLDVTDPAKPVLKVFDGTAWVAAGGATATLPIATATVLGGVKVGSGLDVTADGTLSVVMEIVELLGSADPTAAAPAATIGNAYIANAAGPADASWTGIAGKEVAAGDILLFDGTNWIHNQAASVSGVTSVTGVAPVTIGGTATAPEVSVSVATATAVGVASFGDGLDISAAGLVTLNADEGTY